MSNADGGGDGWQRWAEDGGRPFWRLWTSAAGLGQVGADLQQAFGAAWNLLAAHAPELANQFNDPRGDLAAAFEALQAGLVEAAGPAHAASGQLEPPLEELLDLWSRFVEHQGLANTLSHLPAPALLARELPQLGIFQNRQRQVQEALANLQDYREAQQAYARLLDGIVADALQRTRRRLEQLKAEQQTLEGLRPLYELWLHSSEQAYEEGLASDTYAAAFGRLSNAQVALAGALQELSEELLRAFNLPSQAALREAQQHLHQLRRQQREMAAALAEGRAMREELDELRGELRQLQRKRREERT